MQMHINFFNRKLTILKIQIIYLHMIPFINIFMFVVQFLLKESTNILFFLLKHYSLQIKIENLNILFNIKLS